MEPGVGALLLPERHLLGQILLKGLGFGCHLGLRLRPAGLGVGRVAP